MKVLVIGSKGFLGRYVVDELNKEGYDIVEFKGDARKKDDIGRNIKDCNAVINLIGIIRETKDRTFYDSHFLVVKNLVDVMNDNKVKKLVHISALGVNKESEISYYKTKYMAEEYIVNSNLDYTILRPSFLFGKEDKSINLFIKIARKRFYPIFGDGNYRLQPVYVGDIAKTIADSLKNKKAKRKIIDAAGNKEYSYNELIDAIAKAIGKKVRKIHVSLKVTRFFIKMLGRLSPITKDQLDMLLLGNTTDNKDFNETFKINLKDFEAYLKEDAPYGI